MNADVLRHLRCPLCAQPLAEIAAGGVPALRCPAGHSFDIARQGYVNLLAGRAVHSGDSAEMVAARGDFLAAGHYEFISAALRAAATRAVRPAGCATGPATSWAEPVASDWPDGRPLVIDVGAGTGRHLTAVLDALPDFVGLALDVSKPATRRAARAHPRGAAVLGDTWTRLPVADGSAALILNVFAPRNSPEFRRVLNPDGRLLVVTPLNEHLTELIHRIRLLRVDPAKAERVASSLAEDFILVSETEHRRTLRLTRREVWTLVTMGPSAWHRDPTELARAVAELPERATVTAAVRLAEYRPRSG